MRSNNKSPGHCGKYTIMRKGTYHIPSPTPRPASSKVRQTSRQTRHRLARADTGTLDQTIILHRAQGEIVDQRMTARNKVGTLLDDRLTRGLVGCVDNQGKVLGAHEGRAGGADQREAVFEPCEGFGEVWQVGHLPVLSATRTY